MREKLNVEKLLLEHEILNIIKDGKETIWFNPLKDDSLEMDFSEIDDAEARLKRFSSYIMKAFPETEETSGIIESSLVEISRMKEYLNQKEGANIRGRLMLKCDSHLPISGSIKARGGIYEVLKFAEKVAMENGMLTEADDYSILIEDRFKNLFSSYSIAVGSTGNLGLSIGIISAKLGFKVYVHMSSDARQWKKELLRQKGVSVIEYQEDYSKAVEVGRREAEKDPNCHFVDDESSMDLFLGYAVAARRLVNQLKRHQVTVDEEHPLFVYIPCGVGGAPGGVTFGLRQVFGTSVHCFFAEPTMSPAMTLGLITGLHDGISAEDLQLSGKTEADGLAVSRPSALVGEYMETVLDGCFTINDENLYPYLAKLKDLEDIFVEPSACAAFPGPKYIEEANAYLMKNDLIQNMQNSTHIIWATGGAMVPEDEMKRYYEIGQMTNDKREV